jgi:hypothetical protein
MKIKLALFCGLALAGANAMACYTVYDNSNRVIYQGLEAPVDMSLPIHQTLGARFPGAHMVFDQSTNCTPVRLAQVARPTARDVAPGTIRMERTGREVKPTSASPLFTDIDTAQRQNLPHTVVASNVVMVPPSAAARASIPSLTVIPADTALASARQAQMDATVMAGAPNTATMGAGPARQETVITEMRDGSTVVQQGGRVAYVR